MLKVIMIKYKSFQSAYKSGKLMHESMLYTLVYINLI